MSEYEPDHTPLDVVHGDDGEQIASPGARLRLFRENAAKTRAQLAGLMGCSPETVKSIERGRRELTLEMAVRAAKALNITDLSLLFGPEVPFQLYGRPTHEAIPDVRRALLTHRLDGEPQSVQYLTEAVDSAWQTWHTSPQQRTEVGRVLPKLIHDARLTLERRGDDHREVAGVTAEVYHLAQAYLAWHGDRELCWLSTDRGMSTAREADDPRRIARAAWYYSALLSAIGQTEEAVLELDATLPPIEAAMELDREAAAIFVDAQMRQALNLSRAGDESAWARWSLGRDAALRLLPEGYAHPHTRIGHTLVDVYAVMVAVSLGNGEEAHRRAEDLNPESIPSTERRSRHLLELARGYAQTGERTGAYATLEMAVQASLETVMYSPMAQALTRDLRRHAPASARAGVERLAATLGISS